MTEHKQSTEHYNDPTVPPSTPPVVNKKADAEEAADLAPPSGDSDYPGKHPDESVEPGGDTDDPSIPSADVPPGEEELDRPGDTPSETPAPPD